MKPHQRGRRRSSTYAVTKWEGQHDFALARYNTDGSLDTTFNYQAGRKGATYGTVQTDLGGWGDGIRSVLLQADGKIVAVGSSGGDFVVARYNADGSLDAGFGDGGEVITSFSNSALAAAVAVGADGSIMVLGTILNDDGKPPKGSSADLSAADLVFLALGLNSENDSECKFARDAI